MKLRMTGLIPAAVLLCAAGTPAAQEAVTSAAGPATAAASGSDGAQQEEDPEPAEDLMLPTVRETLTEEEERALQLVQEILAEQDMLLSQGEFVYRAEGRRDPFRSLLQVRQRQLAAPEQRPPGLPGFLINEVEVKAVALFQGRWTAMLRGLDSRTYFANVGTELFDGRIVEIAQSRVVFEQEVEDMLGARTTRRVVKRLSTEPEG